MKAQFCATLRPIFGGKTVEFNLPTGATVQQLLDTFTTEFPPPRTELLEEHGRFFAHAHVFVDWRDAHYLRDGLETILTGAEEISVPRLSGRLSCVLSRGNYGRNWGT
jgi:molybdopterin synthase sulfur carrier subunit